MMTTVYVDWGQSQVKLTWHPTHQPPRPEFITSAHGFCFYEEKMLLVDINSRGWGFPGGHVEIHESPLECVKREVLEEACVEGNFIYLGYVEVNHSENPAWNSDSPYPLIGYQALYLMDITRVLPFHAAFESAQRTFIEPSKVNQLTRDWHDVYEAILQKALLQV